jgi:hypothetical protein
MPLSYGMIQQQALIMNDLLGPQKINKFSASSGFVSKFLSRHGFNDSTRLYGERISTDATSAEEFKITLKNFVNSNNLFAEQIFNAMTLGYFIRLHQKDLY